MNGNQEMGGVIRERSQERSKTGKISSSNAALSEVIYVGRASFRVALEVEAPAAAVETTTWFHPVDGDEHQPVVLAAGRAEMAAPACASEPSDSDGVPLLYDSEVLRAVPRRQRVSRWTIGLPLAFGGFFCGILISPLVSSSRPRHVTAPSATATPPSRVVVAPVAAPVAPVATAVAPVVAPVVAPMLPPETAAPPVTILTETFANRLTTTGPKPGVPVQGRASTSDKTGVHKMAPRRPARIASSSATATTWVDPWADK
jgi:hypothetical protein